MLRPSYAFICFDSNVRIHTVFQTRVAYGGFLFFLILLTGKQCPESKLGLFIKGKALRKTSASYVTNATKMKAWCGQRERMISCLWQQNSAQRNWILSLIHMWKKSSIEIDSFSSRLWIAWSRSTCDSMRVKIYLSQFNQIETPLCSVSCVLPCTHPCYHGDPQRAQQSKNKPCKVKDTCSLLI